MRQLVVVVIFHFDLMFHCFELVKKYCLKRSIKDVAVKACLAPMSRKMHKELDLIHILSD